MRHDQSRSRALARLRKLRRSLPPGSGFDREKANAAGAFLDTNVLVYALAENDRRSARAEELLEAGGIVGVQVLNEFTSVALTKEALTVLGRGQRSDRRVPAALAFAASDQDGTA